MKKIIGILIITSLSIAQTNGAGLVQVDNVTHYDKRENKETNIKEYKPNDETSAIKPYCSDN